jgi:hypothetical protein
MPPTENKYVRSVEHSEDDEPPSEELPSGHFHVHSEILCTWHIDKNVLGRATWKHQRLIHQHKTRVPVEPTSTTMRKTWITNDSEEDEKTAQEFMGYWRNVARSKTLVEFHCPQRLDDLGGSIRRTGRVDQLPEGRISTLG